MNLVREIPGTDVSGALASSVQQLVFISGTSSPAPEATQGAQRRRRARHLWQQRWRRELEHGAG